jgi:hypothetical protein
MKFSKNIHHFNKLIWLRKRTSERLCEYDNEHWGFYKSMVFERLNERLLASRGGLLWGIGAFDFLRFPVGLFSLNSEYSFRRQDKMIVVKPAINAKLEQYSVKG